VRITLARIAEGPAETAQVYSFFPTQQYHRYPWSFSAPFDLTTGREGLLSSHFNHMLLHRIGQFMVRAAIDPSVGNPASPWNLVPQTSDEVSLLEEVWLGAIEEMKSIAWIPSDSQLIRAYDAAFPTSEEVRQLLTPADVVAIAGAPRFWVDGVPPQSVHAALELAGAFRVCCHGLSSILAADNGQREPEWYLRTLAATIDLATRFDDGTVRSRLIGGQCLLNRNAQPFSLGEAGQEGQVVCNVRSEVLSKQLGNLFTGDLVVLLHQVYRLADRRAEDEDSGRRRRVDEWLRAAASESTFQYENRLDAPDFIRHFVVDRKLAMTSDDVADQLLAFVRDHLEAYVSDRGPRRREQTLADLGRSLRIKAYRWNAEGKRTTEYRPITEVYLPAGFVERNAWADAARGVPGLWWVDSSYRSRLARKESPVGAGRFLRDLGAAIGPRIERIPANASHGAHRFFRVTRNATERFPNFPHDQTYFGQYSDYGLVSDSDSADLNAWWTHVSNLPSEERGWRGEALLRALEEQWDSVYKQFSSARALGYYANGAYPIGDVPTRWLWRLRTWKWLALEGGELTSPLATYARSSEVLALLKPGTEPVCAWDTRVAGVVSALGFRVDVPGSVVLRYLREARSQDADIPLSLAQAYYHHLATKAATMPELAAAFDEGLVYSPGSRRRWWRPADCLRGDQRDIFGDLCGYVSPYSTADTLWDYLGIPSTASLDFLVGFWRRIAQEFDPMDPELGSILQPSYALAERLAEVKAPSPTAVPVLAAGTWHTSSEVFATALDELASQITQDCLWRWEGENPDLLPRFLRWIGLLDVETTARTMRLPGNAQLDSSLEERIHQGVRAFAVDIRNVEPELFRALRVRLREIVHGRVQMIDPLRLHFALSHERLGQREYEVSASAYYQEGNLFLSPLTKPSDRTVASALLAGVPLASTTRWMATNTLLLHLTQEVPGELLASAADILSGDVSGMAQLPHSSEATIGQTLQTPSAIPTFVPKPAQPSPPPTPPFPVDEYTVESDEGGEEPGGGRGGLEPRRTVTLRRPGGGGGGNLTGADRQSRRSTEQRAVDVYRIYVLEPAGIAITDQRLRARVGADLVGDDGVFRELKAHSGAASGEISLTEHEYQRAGHQGRKYELVIVEHVWEEPTITIIPDPLRQLKYRPSGGVIVGGWKNLTPKPRIVQLGRC
jgi:hypothetical protein